MLPLLLFLLFVPTISMSTTPSSITPRSSVIEYTFDQQSTRWDWTIEQTIYLTNVLFQQIEDETVGELLYKYLDPHHGKPAIVKFKKTQCRVADVQPISRHPFRRRVQAKKATPLSQSPKSKSNEHRRRLAEHQWTLDIASQDITENIGAIVSQNEWTLNITAQAITEKVGVAVTQKTNKGILKTALSNEWTLAITSQEINEISGVAVTQGDATGTLKTALTGASTSVVIETASDVTFLNSSNVLIGGDEFTFDITAQGIKESAGVTVTQGSLTGTLKTALSNEWTLAVLNTPTIAETAGVTINQGSICSPASSNGACTSISAPANQAACDLQSIGSCAGGGGTQCTSVASGPKATCIGTNDDASQACAWTATNLCTITDKVVGTLKTTLSGGATSVIIETASGVTILDSADVTIGSTVLAHANIDSATNNGATTSVVIETASGVTFVDSANILIGTGPGATVLAANIATATKTKSAVTVVLANIDSATNNGATTSVVISAAAGATFVDSEAITIGSTTVELANIETATNTVSATGTLKTALNGSAAATTSLEIKTTTADVTFVTTADVRIGTDSIIGFANINAAVHSQCIHPDCTLHTPTCKIHSNNETCQNSGIAVGKIGNCSCSCQGFFGGSNCETELPCTSNPDCKNEGTPTGQGSNCGCSCLGAYSGLNCEIKPPSCNIGANNKTCQNQGIITGTYTNLTTMVGNCGCKCVGFFDGENCENELPCTLGQNNKKCENDGTPTGKGKNCGCQCKEKAFTGLYCQMDILYDCDLTYIVRWDTAQDLYVRWTASNTISNDPNVFDIRQFEEIVGAGYRFQATRPNCRCPDYKQGETITDDQIDCSCPSWNVITNISNVPSGRSIPDQNTITVLFDVVHAAVYEDVAQTAVVVLNATGIEQIAGPLLKERLGKLIQLNYNHVRITATNNDAQTKILETNNEAQTKYNSVGVSSMALNITVSFDYDHELHLPLQTMMDEIPFRSWFVQQLRDIFVLDNKQTIRTSKYYNYDLEEQHQQAAALYPEIHWTYSEWFPPIPDTCKYDEDLNFILMLLLEMWCWFRDLPWIVHVICTSSGGGLVLIITGSILFANYKSTGRFCCKTCRCCTEMGRKWCGCCPCCPCCKCCRFCVQDLGEEKDVWCDCSGCKNKCKGDAFDEDENRMTSVRPSITIKGRTKSVHLQLSKIVSIKARPVGAPEEVTAEMFSFEDMLEKKRLAPMSRSKTSKVSRNRSMDAAAAKADIRRSSSSVVRQKSKSDHKSFRKHQRSMSQQIDDDNEDASDDEEVVELSREQSRVARRRSFRG